jgi:hypothetical protein
MHCLVLAHVSQCYGVRADCISFREGTPCQSFERTLSSCRFGLAHFWGLTDIRVCASSSCLVNGPCVEQCLRSRRKIRLDRRFRSRFVPSLQRTQRQRCGGRIDLSLKPRFGALTNSTIRRTGAQERPGPRDAFRIGAGAVKPRTKLVSTRLLRVFHLALHNVHNLRRTGVFQTVQFANRDRYVVLLPIKDP